MVLYDEILGQTFTLVNGAWVLQSTTVPPVVGSTMIGGGTNVMRFGGNDGPGLTNTIAEFDFTTMNWVPLTNSPVAPTPRYWAAGASVNGGTAVVYGGSTTRASPATPGR